MTTSNIKIFTAFVIGILLAAGFSGLMVHALGDGSAGPDVYIEPGSGVETASYIIYKDGDYTCAKNGTTGRIELRNTNASHVIGSVIGNGVVYISPGEYEITSEINVVNNTRIIGNDATFYTSDNDTIIFNNEIWSDDYDSIANVTLTANAYFGQSRIYLNAHSFTAGDYVYVRSDEPWLGTYTNTHASPSYTGDGEIRQISSASATYIDLHGSLISTYLVSENARVYPVSMMEGFELSGVTLIGSGKLLENVGIRLMQFTNITIENCVFKNLGHSAINLYDCQHVLMNNIDVMGSNRIGWGVGVSVVRSSYDVVLSNSVIIDCRHGTSTGQTSYGIPHYFSVTDTTFINAGVRQHPAGIFMNFERCVFENSYLTIENPHTTVSNCNIFVAAGSAVTVGSGDWYSHPHNTSIINNAIKTSGNYHTIFVRDANNLHISQNTIQLNNWTSGDGITGIAINPADGSNNLNTISKITINDNYIESTSRGIYIVGRAGAIVNDIQIDHNNILLKSLYKDAIYFSGSTFEHLKISDNCLYATRYGISIPLLRNSTISDNIISGTHGIMQINPVWFKVSVCSNTITASSNDGAIYLAAGTGSIKHVLITNNDINTTSSRGLRVISGNNITIADNIIRAATSPIILATSSDIKVDNNILFGLNIANQISITSCYRVVINGVGTNGENDPASAGEWKGFGYEGLFVKWNAGATHYLSVYRGGAWYDMVLA